MTTLASSHALVTGGGTGIGAAIAVALSRAGATVSIVGRTAATLEDTANNHPGVFALQADVTDRNSLRTAFEAAQSRASLDIVVANAGAARAAPFARTDMQLWDEMIAVNLSGTFNTLQLGLARLRTAQRGRLIAIASTAGLKGYPYVSAYCAAKHGVIGLVRALALEIARDGITVNAVCPGFTETPMLQRSVDNIVTSTGRNATQARESLVAGNPQGRFVSPQQVAATVAWLCSADADAIHGQAIAVSGGE